MHYKCYNKNFFIIFCSLFFYTANSQETYIIGGQVFAGGLPIDKGRAVIYTNTGQNFVPLDTANIDIYGYYYFTNIPSGDFIVKAGTSTQSIYNENYAPCYYGDELFWENAHLIIPSDNIYDADINLKHINKKPGECSINGTIVNQLNGNICKEEIIFLISKKDNTLTSYIFSDTNGNYAFNNILKDTYTVKVDITGQKTEEATVTFTGDNQTISNVTLYLQGYTNILTNIKNNNITTNIFPNPAFGNDDIFLEIHSGEPCILHIDISSLNGENIKMININVNDRKELIKLNTQYLGTGNYIITIYNKSFFTIKQLLKIK